MTSIKVVWFLALLAAAAYSSPVIHKQLARISSEGRVDGAYRLPNNSVPISYDIKLVPYIYPGNFTFDGEVKIFLTVLVPSENITVHINEITIDESLTTLESEDGVPQNVLGHSYVSNDHFLIVQVQDELEVGNYTLSLSYVGILSNEMRGFYRSSYVNASGDTVWLATTQFEPTHARRAFPCYDEPALKATFDIAIKHAPEFHALCNMPINRTYTDTTDGSTWTEFQTTPAMSTYLVAFVVSDFSAIRNADETYRVWTRPNAISEGQYAFEIGSVELAALEDYTRVTFSLPKMDQISIPDFSSGAMENWGLVTYRESMFYYNENTSTLSTKQTIATVISHEFGHQWFGDLVSPLWWKYLWLNEGFATFFEYRATDEAEDNWRLMEQFVIREQQARAFASDASAFSHPMNQDVASPSEISAIFDDISYAKGGSVIRMMSHFLTERVFRSGLNNYLNANAYSAATSDDLFEALQEAADAADVLPQHVNVKDVMDTWVEQMGYPVLTVTRNYTTRTTILRQERFLLGDANPSDNHNYRWWIPINWVSQTSLDFSSTEAQDWIRSQDESVIISGFNVSRWILFNTQQSGYYRVNYDDTNWGMLASYLDSDDYLNIHVLNRAALIDDSLNLAKADRLSYSVALNVISYLRRELDYIPWYPAHTEISYLHRRLANTNEYESHRIFFASLLRNVYESVGIEETESDAHLTRFNRANSIRYACEFGVESCRTEATAKLVAWLDDSTASPLSATLRTNVICAGLRGADAATWNRALNRYRTTESSAERTALLAGLGCSEDEEIINNWLSSIIDSTSGLTAATSGTAFSSVYQGSAYNVDRTFNFIVNNVDRIVSYFGTARLRTLITNIASRMNTQAQLDRLNAFIAANSASLGSSATIAVSSVQSNIAWNSAYEPEITEFILSALTPPQPSTDAPEATSPATNSPATTSQATTSTTQDPTTESSESSAASAYLSFLSVILAFACLIKIN